MSETGRRPSQFINPEERINTRTGTVNKLFSFLVQNTFTYQIGAYPSYDYESMREWDQKPVDNGVLKNEADAESKEEEMVYYEGIDYEEFKNLAYTTPNFSGIGDGWDKPVNHKFYSLNTIASQLGTDYTEISRAKKALESGFFGGYNLIDAKKPLSTRKTFIALNSENYINLLKDLFESQFFKLSEKEYNQFKLFLHRYFRPDKLYANDEEPVYEIMVLFRRKVHKAYEAYVISQDEEYIRILNNISEVLKEEVYDELNCTIELQNNKGANGLKEISPFLKKTVCLDTIHSKLHLSDSYKAEKELFSILGMIKGDGVVNNVEESTIKEIEEIVRKEFSKMELERDSNRFSLF